MSFFLSSPPQPTYQKSHHQPLPQHSFFTPQTHRTTFFSDSVSWPSLQFQPTSPSPLRPSWNAGNVMRRQSNATKGTEDDYQNTSDGELAGWENSRDTGSSLFAPFTSTSHGTNETPQISSNPIPNTTTTPLFTSQPQQHRPAQTDPTTQRNPFQFQSHSHSSRPTTQISSRIRNNRDTRRSLFLDRLRSSRRDERDNNIIEKFEKEEYWQDRRRREEQMSREAEVQIGWEEEGEDLDVGVGGFGGFDEKGLSPVDEEREVGKLVEGWFEVQQQTGNQNQDQQQKDDFMDAQFDFEDSDVEEAFMQVWSQQEQMQQQQLTDGSALRIGDGDGGGSGSGSGIEIEGTRERHEAGNTDRDAEMS